LASEKGVILTNANLRVDSTKLYQENVESQYEFYEMLRNQTQAASDDKQIGSLISLKDFYNHYNFYCFDLTRTAYKITDKPVGLEFIGKKVNPTVPTDLYHIIVCETVTVINFVSGDVKITNIAAQ